MYEHHKIICDPKQSQIRIDKFLIDRLPNVSRNRIQNAIAKNFVLVNESNTKSNYKIKPLDEIKVVLPTPPSLKKVEPEDIPLDIVFEDKDLLVINKKAGMVVHPGYSNFTGTLANALVFLFQNLPNKSEGEARPGIVHRLDKNTSGLIIVAKNESTMTGLAKQFYDHTIVRSYQAIIWGIPKNDSGKISLRLVKDKRDRKIVTTTTDENIGKSAITHYKILETFQYTTLIECKLETGRTHQIRAHMKAIGHSIFGDNEYGGGQLKLQHIPSHHKVLLKKCLSIIPHQALHSKFMQFIHPTTKKKIEINSELPEVFTKLLEYMRPT